MTPLWPLSITARRRRCLRRAPSGPLAECLRTPLPRPGDDYRRVSFLAVDLETTGLDARHDEILSIGAVALDGDRIDLATARHQLVRTTRAIPEHSAVIHQITDDLAASGIALEEALGQLLAELAGRVLIAHHAAVERRFIDAACRRVYGQGLPMMIVDTQAIARRSLERRHAVYRASDLRLHALREAANLPRYGAHNALSDALACAELFLAQASLCNRARACPLRDVLA